MWPSRSVSTYIHNFIINNNNCILFKQAVIIHQKDTKGRKACNMHTQFRVVFPTFLLVKLLSRADSLSNNRHLTDVRSSIPQGELKNTTWLFDGSAILFQLCKIAMQNCISKESMFSGTFFCKYVLFITCTCYQAHYTSNQNTLYIHNKNPYRSRTVDLSALYFPLLF